jgi:hypothetical protein
MAHQITATKTDTGARIEITTKYGDSTSKSLTATETAALISDLVSTLPEDHHLRTYLHQ